MERFTCERYGNGGLYIGGSFIQVAGLRSTGIAHWNGKAWDDPEGLADGLAKQTGIQSISVSGIAFDATLGSYMQAVPKAIMVFILSWRHGNRTSRAGR